MKSLYLEIFPKKLSKAILKLGGDISIARRKRQLTIEMMCERTNLSKQTYRKIESGDPTVSIGAIAMALFALGEDERIGNLIDVSTDEIGLLIDNSKLPKRIRKPNGI